MLQWMGGSRRKVAATHASVKKRQKQYFEQRRRQQLQLTVGSDSCTDEINSSRPCQRELRSLDILNLLNLSTAVPEHKSSCTESGKGDLSVDSSPLKHNIPGGVGSSSGFNVEPASSKEVFDNQTNDSKGTNVRADLLRESTEQKLSVFDLVADDPTTNMEEGPLCEAHMAFSVEGLGKINTETPVNSPQQSDRIYPSWCSSPWKATSRPDISSVKEEHNDLEKEVDAILESNKTFQGDRPFRFSTSILASGGCGKQNMCHSREYTHQPYISGSRNFFPDTADFNNRRAHYENEWNDRSIFLDDGEESMYLKDQLPFDMESMKADFLKYGNDYLPGRSYVEHHQTKKRDYMETTVRSNIQDSPVQRRQIRERNSEYPSCSRTLYFNSPEKFDFGNVFEPSVWPSFVPEEDKDSLSLRSEESCSSSAAWVDETTISPLKTNTRHRRGDFDSFHNLGDKNYLNNCFGQKAGEDWDGGQHLKRKEGLEEYVRQPNPQKLKSTGHIYSSSFHGGLERPSNWFPEGFTFTDTSSGLSHFSESSTMTPPSSCPKPHCREPSGALLDFLRSESLDITPDRGKPHAFVDLKLGGLHRSSSCTAGSVRETWIPNFSVLGGPENGEHDDANFLESKRKLRPARENKRKTEAVSSENENEGNEEVRQGISRKVNPKATQEQAGETSSSVRMSENSKSLSDENECNYEKEEGEAGRQGNRGTGTGRGSDERAIAIARKTSEDSLQQIVRLERRTLQLVCFEKALLLNTLKTR